MININEPISDDFVDFKTAKILKEKGFDEPVATRYNKQGVFQRNALGYLYRHNSGEIESTYVSAPTLSLVSKWLRIRHLLSLELSFQHDADAMWWDFYTTKIEINKITSALDPEMRRFDSPEKAMLFGINSFLKLIP